MTNTIISTEGGEVKVVVGDKTIIEGYAPFVTPAQLAYLVGHEVYYKEEHSAYKKAGDVLGASCSKVSAAINAAICSAYIDPMKEFIGRFGFYRRVRLEVSICHIIANRNAIMKMAETDNNMAGFCMLFGNEANKLLSEVWGELKENSMSRNDLISVLAELACPVYGRDTTRTVEVIEELNKVPTTILRKFGADYWSVMADMLAQIDKPLCKITQDDIGYGMQRVSVKMAIPSYSKKWTKRGILRRDRGLFTRSQNIKRENAIYMARPESDGIPF